MQNLTRKLKKNYFNVEYSYFNKIFKKYILAHESKTVKM